MLTLARISCTGKNDITVAIHFLLKPMRSDLDCGRTLTIIKELRDSWSYDDNGGTRQISHSIKLCDDRL